MPELFDAITPLPWGVKQFNDTSMKIFSRTLEFKDVVMKIFLKMVRTGSVPVPFFNKK
jgi:hypothetical protein